MKKLIAVALSLVLCLTAFAALAETAVTMGEPIAFEDGLTFALPADWAEVELTPEAEEAGVVLQAKDAAGARTVALSWSEIPEGYTVDQMKAEFEAAGYTEVNVGEVNGLQIVTYTIAASDVTGFCTLGKNNDMYNFVFAPASDAEFAPIAQAILATVAFEAAEGGEAAAE